MREIHWAVLGTGVIANEMATATGKKIGKKLYASRKPRTYEKACKVWKKNTGSKRCIRILMKCSQIRK